MKKQQHTSVIRRGFAKGCNYTINVGDEVCVLDFGYTVFCRKPLIVKSIGKKWVTTEDNWKGLIQEDENHRDREIVPILFYYANIVQVRTGIKDMSKVIEVTKRVLERATDEEKQIMFHSLCDQVENSTAFIKRFV